MRNIKLEIMYDGTKYSGFQIQDKSITIQKVMEDAIFELCGEKVTITGCSRTDSGVHAKKYILNFRLQNPIDVGSLPNALNTKLPQDIVCKKANHEKDNFHARFSCKNKTYEYLIYNGEYFDPFYINRAYHYKFPLDVEKMASGCWHFVGSHDFTSFVVKKSIKEDCVRKINYIDTRKKDNIITIRVNGDGFLHNMVRIIAGTLLDVGIGKVEPRQIDDIILSKDRTHAGITLPACGIYLVNVND